MEPSWSRHCSCARGFRTETMAIGSILCSFQVSCASIRGLGHITYLKEDKMREASQNKSQSGTWDKVSYCVFILNVCVCVSIPCGGLQTQKDLKRDL